MPVLYGQAYQKGGQAMQTTSKLAVILGTCLFVAACGTSNVLGVISAAMLTGLATQIVCRGQNND